MSFNLEGMDPGDVSLRLERRFGIMTRSGLHCCPGAHRAVGTFPQGAVRVSPGPFTTTGQIALFLEALRRIARGRRPQGPKKA